MTKDEALRLALEALEKVTKQMLAIRDELAERGGRPTNNFVHKELWDSSFDVYLNCAIPTAEAIKAALEAKDETYAYGYAKRLAEAIWSKHYKTTAPQWEPFDELIGVLTQIDNMTAGLISPPQRKPLTDEDIQEIVRDASRAGTLSWTGYKEDDEGKYTIPVLSLSDYQFARAIEAAHGIKGEA
jgi:hypothetical protein